MMEHKEKRKTEKKGKKGRNMITVVSEHLILAHGISTIPVFGIFTLIIVSYVFVGLIKEFV
jgi:hypothetical protein